MSNPEAKWTDSVDGYSSGGGGGSSSIDGGDDDDVDPTADTYNPDNPENPFNSDFIPSEPRNEHSILLPPYTQDTVLMLHQRGYQPTYLIPMAVQEEFDEQARQVLRFGYQGPRNQGGYNPASPEPELSREEVRDLIGNGVQALRVNQPFVQLYPIDPLNPVDPHAPGGPLYDAADYSAIPPPDPVPPPDPAAPVPPPDPAAVLDTASTSASESTARSTSASTSSAASLTTFVAVPIPPLPIYIPMIAAVAAVVPPVAAAAPAAVVPPAAAAPTALPRRRSLSLDSFSNYTGVTTRSGHHTGHHTGYGPIRRSMTRTAARTRSTI